MKKITKEVLQRLYAKDDLKEALCTIKYGYYGQYSEEDITEAFVEAERRYLLYKDWEEEYEAFVKATTYECGEKAEDKYGRKRFYPLSFWKKRKIRKRGEYTPLPEMMDLYWVFLIVFVERKLNAVEVRELYSENIGFN